MTCEYFKEYRSTPLVEGSKTMQKIQSGYLYYWAEIQTQKRLHTNFKY